MYHELDRLYAAPESVWVLVRVSSQSNQAEILADMVYLRDQLKLLLEDIGESWVIEITNIDRKIYMKRRVNVA